MPQLDNPNDPNAPLVDPQTENLKLERSLSDRILAYAFAASVVINIGWMVWVSRSDLFGAGNIIPPMKETQIKVFKRPLPPKPKTKPKPPPPPPKQPPPKPQPHLIQHPRPTPPQPHRTNIQVHTTKNVQSANNIVVPDIPSPPSPPTPSVPTYDTPTPPAPPAPVTPPAPVSPPPSPPAPVYHAPPAPPPPVVHPKNWVPIDQQEVSFPDASEIAKNVQLDSSMQAPNSKIVISFTIDENGRVRNPRVKESSGNNDIDNKFLEAVSEEHGTPAVQDHIPRDQPYSISFDIGG